DVRGDAQGAERAPQPAAASGGRGGPAAGRVRVRLASAHAGLGALPGAVVAADPRAAAHAALGPAPARLQTLAVRHRATERRAMAARAAGGDRLGRALRVAVPLGGARRRLRALPSAALAAHPRAAARTAERPIALRLHARALDDVAPEDRAVAA